MQYATDEAKKLAEKGARATYIDDPTVYGWAIHYFEEDSIIGKLYTLDGKELSPEPKKTTPATVTSTRPAKKQDTQMSLFGMMAENAPTMSESDDEESDGDDEDESDEDDSEAEEADEEMDDGNEPDEETEDEAEPEGQGTPFYQCYKKFSAKYHDAVLFMRLGDFHDGRIGARQLIPLVFCVLGHDFRRHGVLPRVGDVDVERAVLRVVGVDADAVGGDIDIEGGELDGGKHDKHEHHRNDEDQRNDRLSHKPPPVNS